MRKVLGFKGSINGAKGLGSFRDAVSTFECEVRATYGEVARHEVDAFVHDVPLGLSGRVGVLTGFALDGAHGFGAVDCGRAQLGADGRSFGLDPVFDVFGGLGPGEGGSKQLSALWPNQCKELIGAPDSRQIKFTICAESRFRSERFVG